MELSRIFTTNIEGKLRNTNLPKYQSLLPIYECVVNSIQAIEDNKSISLTKDGYVEIEIIRENHQLSFISDEGLAKVQSIKVRDNGIGFDNLNYQSFLTSDSTHKVERGSKGLGRFLWLKAFESVHVDSTYSHGVSISRRNFLFTKNGIELHSEEELSDKQIKSGSCITLNNLLPPYINSIPQSVDVVGRRILEHCLPFFILEAAPKVTVVDGNDYFCLNDYFNESAEAFGNQETFKVGEHLFELRGLKFYRGQQTEHEVSFCAHKREVLSKNLNVYKELVDLVPKTKLKDEQDRLFVYHCYISSSFLDSCVSADRTKFNLPDSSQPILRELGEISQEDIEQGAIRILEQILAPYLTKVRESKQIKIQKYITQDAPQYRPLLKYSEQDLASISPQVASSEKKLEIELHRVRYELEKSLKEEGQEIIDNQDKDFAKYPEYRQKYHDFLERYNDFGKSKLAEYIVHRKVVLDIFAQHLKRNEEGRYFLEEDIHEIIVPLRTTSNEFDYQKQNLWMIDERLAYHQFLSSDKPLNSIKDLVTDSKDRPDVLVFDNPMAFVDGEDEDYSSVVIIEFKRPMRNDYRNEEKKNPIDQVLDYILNIQSGGHTDGYGRLIQVTDQTPFYVYIICDLTPTLKRQATKSNFKATPDRKGYFFLHSELNAYIEIISFSKLVSDAKRRNQVLFDQLNLQ